MSSRFAILPAAISWISVATTGISIGGFAHSLATRDAKRRGEGAFTRARCDRAREARLRRHRLRHRGRPCRSAINRPLQRSYDSSVGRHWRIDAFLSLRRNFFYGRIRLPNALVRSTEASRRPPLDVDWFFPVIILEQRCLQNAAGYSTVTHSENAFHVRRAANIYRSSREREILAAWYSSTAMC